MQAGITTPDYDDEKEREPLVSNGLELRGRPVSDYSRNPRVKSYEKSTDIKIRVKDVPLSADDGQILRVLENDSAEGENIQNYNNTEYNEDYTSYYPSHQSNLDNNDDIKEDETHKPIDGAQQDDLINCIIDQSQSILTTTIADNKYSVTKNYPPAARPKVLPARKSGPTNKLTYPDPVKK
ncbi:Hypothetical predicted protein [Mytilus galloprovincialis]|uniref:Uncharacterized protein n=1 Tax=Mytilus galloprovincialis TaxID=29158 RepID=A0A8B6ENW0_MYTGA|nr:Hypothetical predicted protein [Mytilus galloprovincialis]